MVEIVQFSKIKASPGAQYGLLEPTAVFRWVVENEASWAVTSALNERFRVEASVFWPADPLYGMASNDWPTALVLEPLASADLAEWAVALTIAIQRLARDPVNQGRVINRKG
jgi:hypothetical protein